MHSPDHARHPRRYGGRRGFTTLEVVAAAGLVSAGLVSIVPLFVRQARLLAQTRCERLALEELANQAERLAAVAPDDLARHLADLTVSPAVSRVVSNARLGATRVPNGESSRVVLSLSWDAPGRDERPLTLATWIVPASAAGEVRP